MIVDLMRNDIGRVADTGFGESAGTVRRRTISCRSPSG